MGKRNKGKKAGGAKTAPASKEISKKTKNIFKVAPKNKSAQKKTKEIPKKLKQINLKSDKKEKAANAADNQLKDLHLTMVTKKEIKKAQPIAKGKKGKKANPKDREDVEQNINKLKV